MSLLKFETIILGLNRLSHINEIFFNPFVVRWILSHTKPARCLRW
jgi:hypothetical protein